MPIVLFASVLALSSAPQSPSPAVGETPPAAGLKVVRTFAVGGEGSWDYVTMDSGARRLYVPRSSHVLVLDADSGKLLGEIRDTRGVHGVAVVPELGKGFTSNGGADKVTVFDLKTLAEVKTIAAGKNPDALVYEPVTKCVYIGNGRSGDVTVLSAERLEVVATVPLDGKPEALVADGRGKLFVNLEDKSEVARIDAKKNEVERRFSLAPGDEPTGLAMDTEHGTLFSTCHNEMMVVLDANSGKVLATPKIGKRVDGAAFDDRRGLAYAANGDGTLTVVGTKGGHPFTVVQTVKTAVGARTVALDAKTGCLFLPTAEFEPPAEGSEGRQRPVMKKDSFKLLVVGE